MKKQFGEYYLAFDIGTDSVGWAVTDLNYNLERLNGKYMWGTRLFEAGKTAAERRSFRAARRRLQRRTQRIRLLQEIFAEEISKQIWDFFIDWLKASIVRRIKIIRRIPCLTMPILKIKIIMRNFQLSFTCGKL